MDADVVSKVPRGVAKGAPGVATLTPRVPQGGHPGHSRGVPPGTFCITFVAILAVSAPGTSLWVARVSSRRPPWGKCWFLHGKYRCFAKVHMLEPKVPTRLPLGCPGTCFEHLLETLWNSLASLSPPVATPRPHFKIAVDEMCIYAYLLHSGSIRHPS